MKILFVGSGVIGSILAVRLGNSGHDITVLARGARHKQIREKGIIIRNGISGETASYAPAVIERLGSGDYYDLAVVPVRADHLEAILPILASNTVIPSIVIMVNNPRGYGEIIRALGRERFLVGFPGMGGGLEGDTVRYVISNPFLQRTTFGEIDGRMTARLSQVASIFKKAGFPVAVEKNMEAWQKTHVSWIMPFAAAIYKAGGTPLALAGRPDILGQLVTAIRECFRALAELGIPVTPWKLKIFNWFPRGILAGVLGSQCRSPEIEIVAGLHVRNAPGEMKQLGLGLLELLKSAKTRADAAEELLDHIPD